MLNQCFSASLKVGFFFYCFSFENACNTFYMFSPSSPSSYLTFHLVSNDFKATVLKGGFSPLLQLWTLHCFNGIKLVSKHLRILALHKSVSLFWLAYNDKSTSSVVIRWCTFEWTWPSICVGETLYYLPPYKTTPVKVVNPVQCQDF